MIRLNLSNEPKWTTLVGSFEIRHEPVTATVMSIAAREAAKKLPDVSVGADGKPPSADELLQDFTAQRVSEITKSVARAVILEWRGVVDDDTGGDVPVTPETINAVMDIWPIFRAFNERVIDARITVEREKKDLPTSPNGTSGEASDIVPTAKAPASSAPPLSASPKH